GDGDFCRLLSEVQDRGVRVTVVSSTHTQPKLIADALRRKADSFLDLDDIYDELSRG
ncbi:MAG TPA: NYN domain-containing protein, partial [Alphaproteobacteria bacterium]|nr:NYN domain-containing protein [Alphaproteobacteria bacterium]